MVKYASIITSVLLIIYVLTLSSFLLNDWMKSLFIGALLLIVILTLTLFHLKNKEWKFVLINSSVIVIFILMCNLNVSDHLIESFKADKVLFASNNEGLGAINLILRNDNTCEYITFNFLANQESQTGIFKIDNDTLYLEFNKEIYPSNKYYFNKDKLSYIDEWNYQHKFKITFYDSTYFDNNY